MSEKQELDVRCIGCGRYPEEIPEYLSLAESEGYEDPSSAVMNEEGTYNPTNGHFACTECYIEMGMPSAPFPGWKAP